jgi:hypothetical protein
MTQGDAMTGLKFQLYKHIWPVFLTLVLAGLIFIVNAIAADRFHLAITVALFSLGVLFWIQKQRAEDFRLFTGLFESYNSRYNQIRDQLAAIFKDVPSKELSAAEINILVTYFNLCSEQFFLYSNGCIHPEVWEAWRNGMRAYYYNDRIRNLWDKELKNHSHYGFSSQLLK